MARALTVVFGVFFALALATEPSFAIDPNGPAPAVVISITGGSPRDICDSDDPNDCIFVAEDDLLLCKPLSVGLPITACDWELLLDGDDPNVGLDNQLRAIELAPNGNIAIVSLNDPEVPGINDVKKQDILLFVPDDIFSPYLGGGPYTSGGFKLYLNGDLTQATVDAKPWDAFELLADGLCEKHITLNPNHDHDCPVIGSYTSGGTLDDVVFRNEDLVRCTPSGFASQGTIESCEYDFFLDSSHINGAGNGINSDIEALDFLDFDPNTMSGEFVFKKGSGNPPGFPVHDPPRDLLLYTGTFGSGNCVPSGNPCAGDSDCPGAETCNTGACSIGGAPCATDDECPGGGNVCNITRNPAGTVTLLFDGSATGLSGSGEKIEAFAIVPDADNDGLPDGADNCPGVDNLPDVCNDPNSTPCPSNLSAECPSGFFCVQADSDGDGVGDPCDQCIGRPDPGTGFPFECECGDGILDLPSEDCDLGEFNRDANNPDSPCSSTCGVVGFCTGGNPIPCETAAECPVGEGCCGNGILEGDPNNFTGEQCDDANVIDDDLCDNQCLINTGGAPLPPECLALQGPNVTQDLVKNAKFRTKTPDSSFEKYNTKGEFQLVNGVTFDPDSQRNILIYSQTNVLFDARLDPGAYAQISTKLKWKFKDKEGDIVNAESWTKGKHRIRQQSTQFPLNQNKYNLGGKGDKLIPVVTIPIDFNALGGSAPSNVKVRQTQIIGTTCATTVLTCEVKSSGKVLKCRSLFQP